MCGRFSLYSDPRAVKQYFGTTNSVHFEPHYNIFPTSDIIAIHQEHDNRIMSFFHWGFIPHWAKEGYLGKQPINARAETVATIPMFREVFYKRRCLIIADGFFEWKLIDNKKQPYYITSQDGSPIAFAGIWDSCRMSNEKIIDSCAIIVTDAINGLKEIHHRMPVIIPYTSFEAWLNQKQDIEILNKLLLPFPVQELKTYPVSTFVNSPKNDTPQCIIKLD